jgi:hypothetical protein
MAAVTTPASPAHAGEHVHVPAWAFAVALVGMFATYLLLQENGWLLNNWTTVHEFFHDGRHALGVPCH